MMECRSLRPFPTSEAGVSVLEFALCIPVMVGAWLGSAQLFQLENASLKTTQAAASGTLTLQDS